MKFSLNQCSDEVNYRGQRYYPTEPLYYLWEGSEWKEYPTKEEHRRDKQGELVVKDVNRRDYRGVEQGNGGEHYPLQKRDKRY